LSIPITRRVYLELNPTRFPEVSVLPTLSSEQKCNLAKIIAEQTGANADFETFCDCLLGLCEDIPPFETATPREALTRDIWMIYRNAIKAGGQVSREI
jgi:hypothetical protein